MGNILLLCVQLPGFYFLITKKKTHTHTSRQPEEKTGNLHVDTERLLSIYSKILLFRPSKEKFILPQSSFYVNITISQFYFFHSAMREVLKLKLKIKLLRNDVI